MPASTSASAPLVTVVIPAYNHGRYVGQAIDSVLEQDYPHIETIVIDDGSTDTTAAVLSGYASRVSLVSQSNAGQSAAINRGWAAARGGIVSYLSADDRLEPQAVSHALAAFDLRPDAVLVYGDYTLIDPQSRLIRHVTAPEFSDVAMIADLQCAPGPGVFLRRSAADKLDGWRADIHQIPDFDYWLRLSLLGPFVRVPKVLAALRVHPGSASYAVTTPARAEEPVRVMSEYFRRPDLPPHVRNLQFRALSSAHLQAARAHIRSGRLRAAGMHLRTAWRLSPGNLVRGRAIRLLGNAVVNRTGHRLLWYLRHLTSSRPPHPGQ